MQASSLDVAIQSINAAMTPPVLFTAGALLSHESTRIKHE
jgi:hypothetical protein